MCARTHNDEWTMAISAFSGFLPSLSSTCVSCTDLSSPQRATTNTQKPKQSKSNLAKRHPLLSEREKENNEKIAAGSRKVLTVSTYNHFVSSGGERGEFWRAVVQWILKIQPLT